jgi:hypothetical protein
MLLCSFVHCTEHVIDIVSDTHPHACCNDRTQDVVQYGTVSGHAVHSLLRLMQGVYSPKVFASTSSSSSQQPLQNQAVQQHNGQQRQQQAWPESVKKELVSHFHKFMASLVSAITYCY